MAQEPFVGRGHFIIEAARLHSITQTTHTRTRMDERSARSRGFYLTTRNSHNTDKHPCPRRGSNP